MHWWVWLVRGSTGSWEGGRAPWRPSWVGRCLQQSWAREQRGSVGAAPSNRQDAEQLSHVEASSALQKINLPTERCSEWSGWGGRGCRRGRERERGRKREREDQKLLGKRPKRWEQFLAAILIGSGNRSGWQLNSYFFSPDLLSHSFGDIGIKRARSWRQSRRQNLIPKLHLGHSSWCGAWTERKSEYPKK